MPTVDLILEDMSSSVILVELDSSTGDLTLQIPNTLKSLPLEVMILMAVKIQTLLKKVYISIDGLEVVG